LKLLKVIQNYSKRVFRFVPQVNFFQDHTKVVISSAEIPVPPGYPKKKTTLVTFFDKHRTVRTYDVASLAARGCEKPLRVRLAYAAALLKDVIPVKGKQV
jgi:hypothetical protein